MRLRTDRLVADLGARSALDPARSSSSLSCTSSTCSVDAGGFDVGLRSALVLLIVLLPIGFVLGGLFIRRGLVASVAAHMTYNGIVFGLLLLITALPHRPAKRAMKRQRMAGKGRSLRWPRFASGRRGNRRARRLGCGRSPGLAPHEGDAWSTMMDLPAIAFANWCANPSARSVSTSCLAKRPQCGRARRAAVWTAGAVELLRWSC